MVLAGDRDVSVLHRPTMALRRPLRIQRMEHPCDVVGDLPGAAVLQVGELRGEHRVDQFPHMRRHRPHRRADGVHRAGVQRALGQGGEHARHALDQSPAGRQAPTGHGPRLLEHPRRLGAGDLHRLARALLALQAVLLHRGLEAHQRTSSHRIQSSFDPDDARQQRLGLGHGQTVERRGALHAERHEGCPGRRDIDLSDEDRSLLHTHGYVRGRGVVHLVVAVVGLPGGVASLRILCHVTSIASLSDRGRRSVETPPQLCTECGKAWCVEKRWGAAPSGRCGSGGTCVRNAGSTSCSDVRRFGHIVLFAWADVECQSCGGVFARESERNGVRRGRTARGAGTVVVVGWDRI